MRSLLANFGSSSSQSAEKQRSERESRRSARSGTSDRRSAHGHGHAIDDGDTTLTYEQAAKARAFGYGPVSSSAGGGMGVLDAASAPSSSRKSANREHASSTSLSRGFGSFRSKGTKRQASHADLITTSSAAQEESRSQKTLRTSQSLGGGDLGGVSEGMKPPRSPRRMNSHPVNPPSSHSSAWRGYQTDDHIMSDPAPPSNAGPSSYHYGQHSQFNGVSRRSDRRLSRSDMYAEPATHSLSHEPLASSSASVFSNSRPVVPKGGGTSISSGRPPSTFASLKGRFSSLGKGSSASIKDQAYRQERAAQALAEQRVRPRQPSAPTLPVRKSALVSPGPATLSAKSLAVQLNELAVANGDGLLADDEYRMLRQSLFDRLASGETELPKEAAIGAVAISQGTAYRVKRSSTVPDAAQGYLSAPEREASLHSQRSSVTSLLRRVTSRSRSSKSKRVSERSSSIRDGYASPSGWSEDPHTQRLPSRQNGNGTGQASNSSMLSSGPEWDSRSGVGPRGSSTLGRGAGSNSKAARARAAEMEQSVSSARSARSLRGATTNSKLKVATSWRDAKSEGHSNGYDASMNSPAAKSRSSLVDASVRSLSALSLSSANGMLGVEAAQKPSAELNAEIAVVEAEGRRLVEAFNALEAQTVGRYQVEPAQLRRIYSSLGAPSLGVSIDERALRGGSSTSLVVPSEQGPTSPSEQPRNSNRLSFFRKKSSTSVPSRPLSAISSVDSTSGVAGGSGALTPNGLPYSNGASQASLSARTGVVSPVLSDPDRLSPTSYFRPNSSASQGGGMTFTGGPASTAASSSFSPVFGGSLSPSRRGSASFGARTTPTPEHDSQAGGAVSGAAGGGAAETDPELAALKAELATIAARRNGVVERYDERLGLLRSRLRSARIKEGLRG